MANFMYLFRGGMQNQSPAQLQEDMKKWGVWIQELSKAGVYKAGEPLDRTGKQVSGSKKVITDGPFAESKDLVGGYLIVDAPNIDKAVELAKGCPIFDNNGNVEVRPILSMTL